MTDDPTEDERRAMIERGDYAVAVASPRWDAEALRRDFEVIGFLAPFVAVRRRSDGVTGSLEFTHLPRWYFNFVADP